METKFEELEALYPKEERKKLNIYQKMLLIENHTPKVGKNLKVNISQNSSYNAVAVQDVLEAVKPYEVFFGVKSIHENMQVVESEKLEEEVTYKGTSKLKITHFVRVKQISRFINVDNPSETHVVEAMGDGIDSGDKAVNKAETYAIKNVMKKAYNMITSDRDPDADASSDVYKPNTVPHDTNLNKEVTKIITDYKIDQDLQKEAFITVAKKYGLKGKLSSINFGLLEDYESFKNDLDKELKSKLPKNEEEKF